MTYFLLITLLWCLISDIQNDWRFLKESTFKDILLFFMSFGLLFLLAFFIWGFFITEWWRLLLWAICGVPLSIIFNLIPSFLLPKESMFVVYWRLFTLMAMVVVIVWTFIYLLNL